MHSQEPSLHHLQNPSRPSPRRTSVYSIRVVDFVGKTTAIYVGVTKQLNQRWKRHQRLIEKARAEPKSAQLKYLFLSKQEPKLVLFEEAAFGLPNHVAYQMETDIIRDLKAAGAVRVLNTVEALEDLGIKRVGTVKKRGSEWNILVSSLLAKGDEVIAEMEGSDARGVVILDERCGGPNSRKAKLWWTFKKTGKRV